MEGLVGPKNRAGRSLRRGHRAGARHLQVRDRPVVGALGWRDLGEERGPEGGKAQGARADSHRRRRDPARIRKPPGCRSHIVEGGGEDPELEAVLDRIQALSPIPTRAWRARPWKRRGASGKAGRRQRPLAGWNSFVRRHNLVSRALAELRAEAEHSSASARRPSRRQAEAARIERERAETVRREAEASRIEQERVGHRTPASRSRAPRAGTRRDRRRRSGSRSDRTGARRDRTPWSRSGARRAERAETARRQAEAARVERERMEGGRREAEAARAKHERMDTARRHTEAAGVLREREAAERLAAETEIKRQHRVAEDSSVGQFAYVKPPTPSLLTSGRVLTAAAALIALLGVGWFAGLRPRQTSERVADSNRPAPAAPVETTSPARSSSEPPRPKTPAVEQVGASTAVWI